MKYEVDSYKLEYKEKTNQYFIYFKDSIGKDCEMEIGKEIFDTYMKSKKEYVKIKNQYSRHEEHSELTEITLFKRAFEVNESIEDIVIKKLANNELRKMIQKIPKPHNKRLEMYFFDGMTVQEIAKKENKDDRTIRYSISKGLDEMTKIIKKIKNF